MKITKLKLINFRNYEKLDVSFSGGINIIHGDNGQGKTNILEAIYLCATGRSHRTSKDIDLVKIGNNGYYTSVNIERDNNSVSIEISYETEQKKKVRINEIPAKRLGDLMGCMNAVLFSPEDLKIVKEGPSERRRFIDIMISQIKPSYFYNLQQYAKILEQRNNLLKEIAYKPALSDTLEIWDKNLVSTGAKIMEVRNSFAIRIAQMAAVNHNKLTDGIEALSMKYCPSVDCNGNYDTQNIETSFYRTIERLRRQEILKQTTMCGPQRDDYEIMLDDSSLRLMGSQGQQRTAVLALKLSEIDLMKEETGESPILLLDDVMSELDPKRQQFLLSNLEKIQTFISCTETDLFKEWITQSPAYYKVQNGRIIM